MPLITWSQDMSVGVQEMDFQHKGLIEIINKLSDAMSQGKGAQEVGKIVDKMILYAQRHFGAEERLMSVNGYPQLARQKAEHEAFLAKANDFKKDYLAGKIALSLPISSFLKSWWTGHILVEDKQYGPYLNGKGVR